ncbi:MAG: hypothetical protein OEM52_10975 [bacterium]|nr:hypothetical protein [bacterium]
MQVKIDGVTYPFSNVNAIPLREAIKEIGADVQTPRKSIVRVVVDGEDVTGKFQHEVYSRSAQEFSTIELFTGDPIVLALDTLPMMQDFIVRMKAEIGNATEWYRFGKINEASQSMGRIADGLTLITHTVERIRGLLKLDFGTFLFNGEPVLDHYSALGEMIEEIVGAQEESDWILVADLLEYELTPILTTWEGIIQEIEQKGAELLGE